MQPPFPSPPAAWQSERFESRRHDWPLVLQTGRPIGNLLDLDPRLLTAARTWRPLQGFPVQRAEFGEELWLFEQWRTDPERSRQWEMKVMRRAKGPLWRFGALSPDWTRLPAARMGLPLPNEPLVDRNYGIEQMLQKARSERDPLLDYHADATRPGPHMRFADLAPGAPDSFLAFAQRYGLPRITSGLGPQPYPLMVFAFDVAEFRATMDLALAVASSDEPAMRRLVTELGLLHGRRLEDIERGMDMSDPDTRRNSLGEPLSSAEVAVWLTVREHLSGVHLYMGLVHHYGYGGDGHYWSGGASVRTPLDALYLMLYWDLTSQRRLRRCANDRCRMLFYSTRADRAYCSESCRNAAAVRRHYWRARSRPAADTDGHVSKPSASRTSRPSHRTKGQS